MVGIGKILYGASRRSSPRRAAALASIRRRSNNVEDASSDAVRSADDATTPHDDTTEAFSYHLSLAWVTHKYKPQRQWFEVAFIFYKVAVVCACTLLSGADKAWVLLGALSVIEVGFLLLVIVDKPFSDSEQHEGWTSGDKAQVVSQLCLLPQLALAGVWLALEDNGGMSQAVETATVIVTSLCIIFPLLYMWRLDRGHDTVRRRILSLVSRPCLLLRSRADQVCSTTVDASFTPSR